MPGGILGAVRQFAAEIVLRARTSEGAAEAAGDFQRVGAAAEGAATVVERNAAITQSASRAYQRLERALDPLAAANTRFARDQETLRRAFESGAIGAERYRERLGQLERRFDETRASIVRADAANDNFSGGLGRLGGLLGSLRGAVAGFFAAFSFGALVRGANDAIAAFDELAKKARSLGGIGAAGFLQEARFALGNQGLTEEGVDKALARLTRNVGDLRLGQGTFATTLPRLEGGAALAAQLKSAGDLRAQYELVVAALNKIPDAATRAALATAAFGKEAGANIGAIAEGGVEEFRKFAEEARAAGLVVSRDLLERAEVLNDRLEKAGKIVGVSLKSAFLELGPIIADVAEGVAGIVRTTLAGIRDLRLAGEDPGKTESVARLEEQRRVAGAALDRFAAARARNVPLFDFFGDEQKLKDRIAAIDARIEALRRTTEAASGAAGGLNSRFAEFGVEGVDALEKARADLERAQKELAAAASGRAALAAFRETQSIESALDATGLSGDAREALEDLLRGQAEAEAQTKRIEAGWKNVGKAVKAAADIRFDPVADLAADTTRLEALAEAARLGAEELAQAERRFEIEDAIAALKAEAARAGRDVTENELAAARAELTRQQALRDELSAAAGRGGGSVQEAEDFARPYRQALGDVAEDFIRRLGRGDLSSFRDFARSLKNILLDAVLDPFARAFSSLLQGAVFGGGPFTPGIGGASPANAAAAARGGLGGLRIFGVPVAAAAQGLFSAVGSGLVGLSAGQAVSNLLGLEKRSIPRGLLTGAVGGGVGGALAGTLAFTAAGAPLGAALGLGAAAGGPIGLIAGLVIGGLIAAFRGKPSDKTGQFAFDPATGAVLGAGRKDASAATERNVEIARAIQTGISDSVSAILRITGGSLGGFLLNVAAGSRDGIRIGAQPTSGDLVNFQRFDNTEKGAEQAVAAGVGLALANLQGANEALGAVAKSLVAAGTPIDDVVERLGRLKAVLADPADVVDPLRARIDALIDAFAGLDRSTGALKDAFDKAAAGLARAVDEESRRGLLAEDNPALLAVEDLLKVQAARRAEVARLESEGGNVDNSLLAEFQRRQILSQFSAPARIGAAADPVKAGIDKLIADQAAERAAFRRAIEGSGGLVTEADFLTLIRAQEAERLAAFRGLSDADKARLSGRAGDFDDLTARYAATVEKLIAAAESLRESFEAERARLQSAVETRGREIADLTQGIDELDRRRGLATPGQSVALLRGQLEDLGRRALSSDPATFEPARAQLRSAAGAYVDRLEQVYGSGRQTAEGAVFARNLLAEVRDRAGAEKSLAERQLSELELARRRLDEMVELLRAPRLDVAALVAATQGLSPDNPIAVLAIELATLEAARTEQSDRLVAALEALRPADVGLVESAPAGSATPASSGAAAGPSNSPAPDEDSEVSAALYANAAAIDRQTDVIVSLDTERRKRDERIENYLKTIATRRASEL